MAHSGRRGSGGNEEKAFDTDRYDAQGRHVNSSTRPTNGTSSRYSQHDNDHQSHRINKERSRSPYRRNKERSRSPYRRNRDRSRSPYRAQKDQAGQKRGHDSDHYNTNSASDPRRLKAENDQFKDRDLGQYRNDRTRDRSRSPFRRNRNVAQDVRRGSLNGSATTDGESHTASKPDVVRYALVQGVSPSTDSGASISQPARKEPTPEPEVKLSESDLIAQQRERRRKRREQLEAEHKGTPSLLMKALEQTLPLTPAEPGPIDAATAHTRMHIRTSSYVDPDSITAPSARESPQPGSPASGLFSPASFVGELKDEDIINHHQTDDPIDNGPSAADYDPTMDMQEDRRDLQQQQQQQQQQQLEAVPPPATNAEYDMFAEDDDMFAEADNTTLAKPAKTLAQGLLDNWDHPDGHYRIIHGELLDGKYAVEQQIGKGTFATVVRAQCVPAGTLVAVKIACNNDTMYKAGTKELEFLEILNESDPEDKRHIVRFLGKFDHKGHLCLVFEAMSMDLRETLKKYGRNVGINLTALRAYSHQMFRALDHMRKNEILHADLKPDNILVTEKKNAIKICDFGTASFVKDAEITPYLVSRFYRAPEVMLGMPIDYAIDMWSIGCTIFELYTGRILFAGSDNNQMLRAIQECRGKIPIRMLKKSTLFDHHFDQHGNFISIEKDRVTGQTSLKQPNFTKVAEGKDLRSRLMASAKDTSPKFIKEMQTFVDLLDRCLQLDPARRITPAEALKHPFIIGKIEKIAALAPKTK